MQRNSIITAFALALVLGTAGVAGAQGVASPDRPRDAQHEGGFGRDRGGPEAMLLNGITLTADQQARIKDLGDRQRQQMEAERAQRGNSGDARAARERGDTTGLGARRAQMQQRREQHVAAIRAILNADQRVQFDKNVADLKTRMAERGRERPDR